MARRLGATAPAVNKRENENSFPDITLLAPIARLLDISLDTLLAYQEELMAEEIRNIVWEMDAQRLVRKVPDAGDYDGYIDSLYERVLNSRDEAVRIRAADS